MNFSLLVKFVFFARPPICKLALISLFTGIPVKNDVAMTGEIDLNGFIHEIGGLEEKLEGAKRAGVKLVLCPMPDASKAL